MSDIKLDEVLWSSRMDPEGIVERWFVADGQAVTSGERIAEIQIEGAVHEIVTPWSGRLTIVASVNALVQPGSVMATVTARAD